MHSFNIYKPNNARTLSSLTFKWCKNLEVIHSSIFEIQEAEDLNDGRLGATITDPCLTCGLKWEHCAGHFGHYTFLYPLSKYFVV